MLKNSEQQSKTSNYIWIEMYYIHILCLSALQFIRWSVDVGFNICIRFKINVKNLYYGKAWAFILGAKYIVKKHVKKM